MATTGARGRDRVWRLFRKRSKRTAPKLSNGVRIYAIGDVHGRADLLEQAFARIDADIARRPGSRAAQILLVLLGDYVDRGRFSREVVERLLERRRTHTLICLKGNHERCLLEFLREPSTLASWRQLGGRETLASYGVKPPLDVDAAGSRELAERFAAALPESHRAFLEGLELSFCCGDFFFVHAGVRPGLPLSRQKEEDLLWIRDDFLLCEENFGKVVVHGHTPVLEPDLRANRINIDTGAYATGKLTCIMIEEDAVFVL
ncbi:MAG: metallophosphoesterase family protein [Roseiarcus sp.]